LIWKKKIIFFNQLGNIIVSKQISVFGSVLNRNFGRNQKIERYRNRNRNRNAYRNRNFGRYRYRNRKFPITSWKFRLRFWAMKIGGSFISSWRSQQSRPIKISQSVEINFLNLLRLSLMSRQDYFLSQFRFLKSRLLNQD
jgi:hypothetical protein